MSSANFGEIVSTASSRQLLTEGSWSGWLWLGKRWRLACTAGNLTEASSLLSQAADAAGSRDADSCLTRGAAPSWTPDVVLAGIVAMVQAAARA
jgi:hypothetical protein